MRTRIVLLAGMLAVSACGDNQQVGAALLAAPNALAVAGTDGDRLFVANAAEDALQILDVSVGIDAADFVASPSVFNPLRIPVGPNPNALVASQDGAWVAVLDPIGQAIRLIDADALRVVRTASEEPYLFVFPNTEGLPRGLVADPSPCTVSGCAGRFFVALSGAGEVVALRFMVDVAGAYLALDSRFDVGGRPGALSLGRDGRFVYGIDYASDELMRIDPLTGTVSRAAVGGKPGTLSVAGDVVVVARPVLRDVVAFQSTDSALSPVPVDPAFGPVPRCIAPCDALDSCEGAHLADQSLCSDGRDGLLDSGAVTYDGAYLGVTPAHMVAFSAFDGDPQLKLRCNDSFTDSEAEEAAEGESERTVDEYVFVAAQQPLSSIAAHRWLEIDRSDGLTVRLVDNGYCETAFFREGTAVDRAVVTEGEDVVKGLDTWIDACPPMPDRNRFTCIPAESDSLTRRVDTAGNTVEILGDESGVVLDRGRVARTETFELDWEGAVNDRVDSTEGGGTVTEDGNFKAAEFDITEQRLVVGDILEVLSTPRFRSEDCAAELGNPVDAPPRCELERRIVDFDRDSQALVLDAPLPTTCFPNAGTVSFRVRAGDSYVVRRGGTTIGIVKPGEFFGPGGTSGLTSPISMRLEALETATATPACERYGPDEGGATVVPPELRRDRPIEFEVHGDYQPQISGRDSFTNDNRDAPDQVDPALGELPTAILRARFPVPGGTERTYVVIAFAGTDSLLILRPDAPLNADLGNDAYRNDIRVVN